MPRVDVTPNPGANTKGIRYYRPKPYLLITPFGASTTTVTETPSTGGDDAPPKTKTETKVTELTDQYVQIDLQYLPDFSEEYAINIRTGFGTNETELVLENGWNLTSLNTKLDSQTDDNIKAIADLVSSVGSVAGPGVNKSSFAGETGDGTPPAKNVVCATNVPIGYYESVIGRDRCGRKQLQGWRYVGFAPFNGCPMNMCGSESVPCNSIELYGLAFENGVMRFKRLYEVQQIEGDASCIRPQQTAGKCDDQPCKDDPALAKPKRVPGKPERKATLNPAIPLEAIGEGAELPAAGT